MSASVSRSGWRSAGRPATRSASESDSQRGSATVLTVSAIAVIFMLVGAAIIVTGYVLAARRAGQAADLAALSAAATIDFGEPGCPVAEQIALKNGARVVNCDHVGDVLEFAVTVEVRLDVSPPLPGMPDHVASRASAGCMVGVPDTPGHAWHTPL